MTTDDDRHWDDASIAEFALGVLPPGERAALEADLARDPGLRARLRGWDERLAMLADHVDPVLPPRHVLDGAKARLFGETAPQSRGLLSRLGFWQAVAGLSLAALTAVVVVPRVVPTTTPPALVSVLQGGEGAVRVAALYDTRSGTLRLHREAGEVAADRAFELWLIEGGNNPVSLGVMPDVVNASVVIAPELRARLAGGILAISDEPSGGSPTGQPTGPVVATGVIASL